MDNSKYHPLSLPAKVSTKLGSIFITPTDANHLHVHNGGSSENYEGFLTLRGIQYHVSAHFYRWKDGSFQIGEETKSQYERRQSLYATRKANVARNPHVSFSAHDKLAEVLTKAVNEWTAANPQVIAAANIKHLQNKVETAQGEVENAKKVLKQAQADLTAAEENLRVAEKAVRS